MKEETQMYDIYWPLPHRRVQTMQFILICLVGGRRVRPELESRAAVSAIQNTHQNSALDFIGQQRCALRMRKGGFETSTAFFITSETVSRPRARYAVRNESVGFD